eukprot:1332000-Amphidinium_carterae.1
MGKGLDRHGQPSLQALSQCWQFTFELHCGNTWAPPDDKDVDQNPEKAHPPLSTLKHLRQISLKLMKVITDLKGEGQEEELTCMWLKPCLAKHAEVEKGLEKETKWWVTNCEQAIDAKCVSLQTALQKGRAWQEGFKSCKTYPQAVKLGKETLLQVNPKKVEEANVALKQAIDDLQILPFHPKTLLTQGSQSNSYTFPRKLIFQYAKSRKRP